MATVTLRVYVYRLCQESRLKLNWRDKLSDVLTKSQLQGSLLPVTTPRALYWHIVFLKKDLAYFQSLVWESCARRDMTRTPDNIRTKHLKLKYNDS